MPEFNLDAGDEGTVYPVFGSNAAGLPDNSAELAVRETHLFGIEGYLVLLRGILVDKIDETVKNGLLTGHGVLQAVAVLVVEVIVMVHLGGDKAADHLAVVVFLMNRMPKRINDTKGNSHISFRCW